MYYVFDGLRLTRTNTAVFDQNDESLDLFIRMIYFGFFLSHECLVNCILWLNLLHARCGKFFGCTKM